VTATHTSTVYLIGFLTLAGSAYFAPDRVYLYLGVAAGVSIVLMGTILFAARLLDLYRRGSQRSHRHGLFARPHAHGSDGHDGALAGPAGPDHGHGPAPVAVEAAGRVSWRSLLTLGVVGGLLPCPSAIIVMLAAIAIGQVVYGMLLIVAFSAGLAGVLTAIGITLVLGKRLSRRSRLVLALDRPSVSRVTAALPVVSALVIVLAGIAVTYQALQQPGL
jgi:ABC-type nickel/cobalt efflux system permease component RcnA